jgi:arylsulfatase A-like enzyme
MSDSLKNRKNSGLVWRQFLIGQTFGVAFAFLLFLVEPVWLMRAAHGHFGASLGSVLAVYAAFGWLLGAALGVASGLVGRVFNGARRKDGTVPGVGPVLGFLMMALFIVRFESSQTLKTLPGNVIVSLVAAALAWVGLGYLGRRFLVRTVPVRRRTFLLNALALAATLTFVASAVSSQIRSVRLPRRTAAAADSPNIVLVVVDALRLDRLTTYGYDRETSPHLDEFAKDGLVFDNAYSQGNRTAYAMPSLFTGLYPSFLGVVAFKDIAVPLPEDRTTIADVCRDAGYTTVGLMSNVNLKSEYGMTKGFDYAEEFDALRFRLSVYRLLLKLGLMEQPSYRGEAPDATILTDRGIEWLRRIKDRPFFLFMHYMDVHHPYDPPEEYVRMFETDGGDIDPKMLFAKTVALLRRRPPLHLAPEELTRLENLYDGGIRHVDDEFGRFLDELASMDLDRKTVVIFTADHGDEFLEQGLLYDNNLAIETLIRVPLVIGTVPAGKLKGAGKRMGTMVRHVDVLPTVADLTGGKTPAFLHGTSLMPILKGAAGAGADYSIAEGDFCTSLNMGHWKIMYVDTTNAYHLYKLDDDPLGKVDVGDRYPLEAARLKAAIDEYLASAAGVKR